MNTSSSPPRGALAIRVVIVWVLLCALMFVAKGHALFMHRFPDPDDALRLVQVRDLLAGQSWFDVHQYRIAAPEGVPMHWSRLVDIPIAAMILALRPLLGQPLAETMTCIVVPLLTLLCALALIGRLAGRLFTVEIAGFSCLLAALSVPAMFQFQPMRIDHHAWQIVLALAALNGLAETDRAKGGWIIGLSMAASLAISIEGLPLTAAFVGVLALRFLRNRADVAGLVHGSAALALGSIAFFLGTRGLTDLAEHCDTVSPAHLAAFAAAALGCLGLTALRNRPPLAIAAAGAAVAAISAAIVLAAAPSCANGAFAALDPLVRKFWYANVFEGQPVWNLTWRELIFMVGPPVIGLAASLRLLQIAPTATERAWWFDFTLIMLAATLIGLMVTRACGAAALIATVPTGWLLRDRIDIARIAAAPVWRRVLRYATVLLLVFPGVPVVTVDAATQVALPARKPQTAAPQAYGASSCDYDKLAVGLRKLPDTDIFAPLDPGPRIILDTGHRVIATGHHRGVAGIHDVIAAFIAPPDEAKAIVVKRHATLLLICPDQIEADNYRTAAPKGLMAALLSNRAPSWLTPVDLAPGSHFKAWRVSSAPADGRGLTKRPG
ncbi:hypothetical protein [Novosphingobium sp.]|uniref:hypothetical protein n=1 Tax=Novosphingobium sp. TaxID=1874826 RepID=UPI0025D29ADD|nr:hypothetical protein [Novosphingobium sp.]